MRARSLSWVLVVAALGCGGSTPLEDGSCVGDIGVGDLVITEIYGNSPGSDEGNEWFEIYNASSGPINLKGMLLVKTDEEGDSRKEHVMREIFIEAGQYMVVGEILERFKFEYIDYGYANDLGAMGNSAGRLLLQCDKTIVDEVGYVDLPEGESMQLSGLISPPNAVDNDDFSNFCSGGMNAFFRDEIGTPQTANEICAPLTQDDCIDGMMQRSVVKAQAGDVEITEFLPGPQAVPSAVGEWIELRINANIDLNGIQLGRAEADTGPGEVRQTIAAIECLPASPGDYIVLARSTDSTENGGVDADFPLSFGVVDSDDGLYVGLAGAVYDVVLYASSSSGKALQIDADGDGPCNATMPYGLGDLGTPGQPNTDDCPVVIPDGMCIDPDDQQVRAIVSPTAPGQVKVNEWMPNPDSNPGGSDTTGEWVEIIADGGGPYDLNGLIVDAGSNATLTSNTCLEIAANGLFLVADSDNALENGGMTNVDYAASLSITNSSMNPMDIVLRMDATTFDTVIYTSSATGTAIQIDRNGGNQCNATQTYGDGDLGTPGNPNDLDC